MNDSGPASAPTPAQVLVTTAAPDDAGAETYDRFDWQCAMATADLLSLFYSRLTASPDSGDAAVTFELYCEHHEDWAFTKGAASEIVSAKHHEREFGTYSTLKMLLDDGGVLHLFDRWVALGKSPHCRLVTTSALSSVALDLEKACAHFAEQSTVDLSTDECRDLLENLAKEIRKRRLQKLSATNPTASLESIVPESPDSLAAFLRVLRIDHGRPYRDDLEYSASSRYAMPVAVALGRPDAADAIWSALLDMVRQRMRAAGPNARASLPLLLGAADESGFEKRMLTLADVETIVQVALANTSAYGRLPKKVWATKVAVKMDVGGCSDTAIGRAERLRLQYRAHWRAVTSGPSKIADERRVLNMLHRVAEEEVDLVSHPADQWGKKFWTSVQARVDALEGTHKANGLDADLLLGGVAELSNNCVVWFSPRFDVAERLRQLADEATS